MSLTPEEIAAIRQRAEDIENLRTYDDVTALLAEAERLRAALTRSQEAHAVDVEVAAQVRGRLRSDLAVAERKVEELKRAMEGIEKECAKYRLALHSMGVRLAQFRGGDPSRTSELALKLVATIDAALSGEEIPAHDG